MSSIPIIRRRIGIGGPNSNSNTNSNLNEFQPSNEPGVCSRDIPNQVQQQQQVHWQPYKIVENYRLEVRKVDSEVDNDSDQFKIYSNCKVLCTEVNTKRILNNRNQTQGNDIQDQLLEKELLSDESELFMVPAVFDYWQQEFPSLKQKMFNKQILDSFPQTHQAVFSEGRYLKRALRDLDMCDEDPFIQFGIPLHQLRKKVVLVREKAFRKHIIAIAGENCKNPSVQQMPKISNSSSEIQINLNKGLNRKMKKANQETIQRKSNNTESSTHIVNERKSRRQSSQYAEMGSLGLPLDSQTTMVQMLGKTGINQEDVLDGLDMSILNDEEKVDNDDYIRSVTTGIFNKFSKGGSENDDLNGIQQEDAELDILQQSQNNCHSNKQFKKPRKKKSGETQQNTKVPKQVRKSKQDAKTKKKSVIQKNGNDNVDEQIDLQFAYRYLNPRFRNREMINIQHQQRKFTPKEKQELEQIQKRAILQSKIMENKLRQKNRQRSQLLQQFGNDRIQLPNGSQGTMGPGIRLYQDNSSVAKNANGDFLAPKGFKDLKDRKRKTKSSSDRGTVLVNTNQQQDSELQQLLANIFSDLKGSLSQTDSKLSKDVKIDSPQPLSHNVEQNGDVDMAIVPTDDNTDINDQQLLQNDQQDRQTQSLVQFKDNISDKKQQIRKKAGPPTGQQQILEHLEQKNNFFKNYQQRVLQNKRHLDARQRDEPDSESKDQYDECDQTATVDESIKWFRKKMMHNIVLSQLKPTIKHRRFKNRLLKSERYLRALEVCRAIKLRKESHEQVRNLAERIRLQNGYSRSRCSNNSYLLEQSILQQEGPFSDIKSLTAIAETQGLTLQESIQKVGLRLGITYDNFMSGFVKPDSLINDERTQEISTKYRYMTNYKLLAIPSLNKDVRLMRHQVHALGWLVGCYMQSQSVLFCDDIGMGKSLTCLAFLDWVGSNLQLMETQKVINSTTLQHWAQRFQSQKAQGFNFKDAVEGKKLTKLGHLILCPCGVIDIWIRELKTKFGTYIESESHSNQKVNTLQFDENGIMKLVRGNLRCVVLSHDWCLKTGNFLPYNAIVITTFEVFQKKRLFFTSYEFDCIIVDESHKLKDSNSRLQKVIQSINYRMAVLVTGQPVSNNLSQFWTGLGSILFRKSLNHIHQQTAKNTQTEIEREFWINNEIKGFIDQVTTVVKNRQTNESDYSICAPIKPFSEKEKRQIRMAFLGFLIRPIFLRRLKEDIILDLPPKREVTINCALSVVQEMEAKMIQIAIKKNLNAYRKGKINIKLTGNSNEHQMLKRVHQHPALNWPEKFIKDYLSIDELIKMSTKLETFDRIIMKFILAKRRVIVFSSYPKMLDILSMYMDAKKIDFCRIDGGTSLQDRQKEMDRFTRKSKVDNIDSFAKESRIRQCFMKYFNQMGGDSESDKVNDNVKKELLNLFPNPEQIDFTVYDDAVNFKNIPQVRLKSSPSLFELYDFYYPFGVHHRRNTESTTSSKTGGLNPCQMSAEINLEKRKQCDFKKQSDNSEYTNSNSLRSNRFNNPNSISRDSRVNLKNSLREPFVMLLSTSSGALGLNLQKANVVIFLDSDFNDDIYNQAVGRVHRIGQTQDVLVIRLKTAIQNNQDNSSQQLQSDGQSNANHNDSNVLGSSQNHIIGANSTNSKTIASRLAEIAASSDVVIQGESQNLPHNIKEVNKLISRSHIQEKHFNEFDKVLLESRTLVVNEKVASTLGSDLVLTQNGVMSIQQLKKKGPLANNFIFDAKQSQTTSTIKSFIYDREAPGPDDTNTNSQAARKYHEEVLHERIIPQRIENQKGTVTDNLRDLAKSNLLNTNSNATNGTQPTGLVKECLTLCGRLTDLHTSIGISEKLKSFDKVMQWRKEDQEKKQKEEFNAKKENARKKAMKVEKVNAISVKENLKSSAVKSKSKQKQSTGKTVKSMKKTNVKKAGGKK